MCGIWLLWLAGLSIWNSGQGTCLYRCQDLPCLFWSGRKTKTFAHACRLPSSHQSPRPRRALPGTAANLDVPSSIHHFKAICILNLLIPHQYPSRHCYPLPSSLRTSGHLTSTLRPRNSLPTLLCPIRASRIQHPALQACTGLRCAMRSASTLHDNPLTALRSTPWCCVERKPDAVRDSLDAGTETVVLFRPCLSSGFVVYCGLFTCCSGTAVYDSGFGGFCVEWSVFFGYGSLGREVIDGIDSPCSLRQDTLAIVLNWTLLVIGIDIDIEFWAHRFKNDPLETLLFGVCADSSSTNGVLGFWHRPNKNKKALK